jgi:hypothetical protein
VSRLSWSNRSQSKTHGLKQSSVVSMVRISSRRMKQGRELGTSRRSGGLSLHLCTDHETNTSPCFDSASPFVSDADFDLSQARFPRHCWVNDLSQTALSNAHSPCRWVMGHPACTKSGAFSLRHCVRISKRGKRGGHLSASLGTGSGRTRATAGNDRFFERQVHSIDRLATAR